MTILVASILVFIAIGATMLLANLLLGKLVRPNKPSPEKGEIYECGEQAVGTSWIQFDLRFYVIALLFVIFDVEMAFFFPWATVFGTANKLGDETIAAEQRLVLAQTLNPSVTAPPKVTDAQTFARFAFWEMVVFFAVLLVGFAYLWRRGDLEWVRSMEGQLGHARNTPIQT